MPRSIAVVLRNTFMACVHVAHLPFVANLADVRRCAGTIFAALRASCGLNVLCGQYIVGRRTREAKGGPVHMKRVVKQPGSGHG
jgi:hypothetical protein